MLKKRENMYLPGIFLVVVYFVCNFIINLLFYMEHYSSSWFANFIGSMGGVVITFAVCFACFVNMNRSMLFLRILLVVGSFGMITSNIYEIYFCMDILHFSLKESISRILSSGWEDIVRIIVNLSLLIGTIERKKEWRIVGYVGIFIFVVLNIWTIIACLNNDFLPSDYDYFALYAMAVGNNRKSIVVAFLGIILNIALLLMWNKAMTLPQRVRNQKVPVVKNMLVAEETLETLKEKFDAGEINEFEYSVKRAELISKL